MIENPEPEFFSITFVYCGVSIKVWPEFMLNSDIDSVPRAHSLDSILRESEKMEDTFYLPGTYSESVHGYYHNTLPVVFEGQVILDRRKILSNYQVYDWAKAAKALGLDQERDLVIKAAQTLDNPTTTDMTRNQASEIEHVLYKGPKGRIQDVVRKRARSEATDSVTLIQQCDLNILPVICNEVRHLSSHVTSPPDIIAEVAYAFDNWRPRYQSLVNEGVVMSGTYLVRADGRYPNESGVYMIEQGQITTLSEGRRYCVDDKNSI